MPERKTTLAFIHSRSAIARPLTKLILHRLERLNILLVLLIILALLPDTLINSNSSGVIVNPARSPECRLDDLGRRDEVVSEAVVQASLQLEKVLYRGEEVDVARGEAFG